MVFSDKVFGQMESADKFAVTPGNETLRHLSREDSPVPAVPERTPDKPHFILGTDQ